jgi:hypothetical protein
MKRIYIYISIFLFAASCTQNAGKVKIPKTEKLLVVQSIISPYDQYISVKVNWTQDYFNNPNQNNTNSWVDNCIVQISSNGNTYTLAQGNQGEYYIDTTTLKIVPGQTYNLYVKEPGGKEATSSCVVPSLTNSDILYMSIDSETTKQGQREQKNYILNCEIIDDGSKKDYYTLYPATYYYFWEYIQDPNSGNIIDSTWKEQRQDIYMETDNKFLDDASFNSQVKKVKFNVPGVEIWTPRGNSAVSPKLETLELLTIYGDLNYYKYHRSIEVFNQNNGDPFAEPTLIYSNISGGIGIFSAYIQKRKLVKL